MKQLNNSQPLAVTTQYTPLSTSMSIVVKGGLSTVQFYRQNLQAWVPDHTHAEAFNDQGMLVDGPITLYPEYSIVDKDNLVGAGDFTPQIRWFVDGKRIVDTEATHDYYILSDRLVVRKNFTHLTSALVECECEFVDPRTKSPFVLSASTPLSAVLQADEQWNLSILADKTRKHFPLHLGKTQYTFQAEARLGNVIKSADVLWFWDFSEDQGKTWNPINSSSHWYVSGKDTSSLVVDMDYIDDITVRCRIAQVPNGVHENTINAPNLPNEATASLAWRYPSLQPMVFCYGGNKIFSDTTLMTFGLIVHCGGRSDLTEKEQEEWLLCNWNHRLQGVADSETKLPYSNTEISVPASLLRSSNGSVRIVDPNPIYFRGPFAEMALSTGAQMQTSEGRFMMIRH